MSLHALDVQLLCHVHQEYLTVVRMPSPDSAYECERLSHHLHHCLLLDHLYHGPGIDDTLDHRTSLSSSHEGKVFGKSFPSPYHTYCFPSIQNATLHLDIDRYIFFIVIALEETTVNCSFLIVIFIVFFYLCTRTIMLTLSLPLIRTHEWFSYIDLKLFQIGHHEKKEGLRVASVFKN